MKNIKEIIPYIIILICVIVIRTFIVTPVIVTGTSMNNTLSDGEVLLLKKYDQKYKRFDIVVLNYNGSKLIKRVIGLPGDYVKYEDGNLYVNGELVEDEFANITSDFDMKKFGIEVIPDNFYFVVGDNRNNSSDSRVIGLISKEDIVGTTDFSLLPFKKIK